MNQDIQLNIAKDVFPHGASVKCATCGNERALTRADCAVALKRGWPTCCGYTMTLYIRTDTIAELRRQNAALKEFANAVIDIAIQSQAHSINISGAEIEDIAKKHTIIEGEREGRFAPWMLSDTAMPAPSKAKVAREFLEVLCDRGPLAVRADGLQRKVKGYGEEILKEWEDAESK